MGRAVSENSDIPSEASRLVREWAGPRLLGDTAKALIRRAARRLGFTFCRTKALYYREARRIGAEEMDALRRREKAAYADSELGAIRRRIARLERHLDLLDAQEAGAAGDASWGEADRPRGVSGPS
jgi:ubiquinone biosynthesis protein UbiJ